MQGKSSYAWRFYFLVFLLIIAVAGLVWRMVYLNILDHDFLQRQSDARTIRTVRVPAYRGMIIDRNGEPLAISTPMDSVWVNPQMFQATPKQRAKLTRSLGFSSRTLRKKLKKKGGREFVYLRRRIPPKRAAQIKALEIPGIFFQREYKRYYPEAQATAHLVGFTNVDDKGQEGLELAFNQWLAGVHGKKRVLKDRLGHVVANLDIMRRPRQGRDLQLSIDRRIQYLAYRELKKTVDKFKADSGSVVALDVETGEVLAMVNLPSYNPNNRPSNHNGRYRNRAVTDTFEPGSTMKAFSIASILESGKYTPEFKVDTNPGRMVVDGYTIRDDGLNYGIISIKEILQHSSNIGMAKLTLSLPPEHLWEVLDTFGFGQRTGSGFPGEAAGSLVNHRVWRPIVLATLAYGYGVSVTPLQLARAYAIIAANGIKRPVTFLKLDSAPKGERVIKAKWMRAMLDMLEAVVQTGGTGTRAKVPGYRVAGKTGTAYIAGPNGYDKVKKKYMSDFVGIAPASKPRIVVAVIIRNPHGQHFGSLVAAPAFSRIMEGALRIMNIPPDAFETSHA